jgi:hypothetical protein
VKKIVALLGILVIPATALAIGEQTGRLKGVVVEAHSQTPLASVQIAVSGPALIGEPRVASTGNDGRFELVDLPPGRYTVAASYPGSPATTRTVRVVQGETAFLRIAWTPEGAEEAVSVVETRPVTRADSAQSGRTLEADTLARIPTGRQYYLLPALLPGVRGGDNPNIKGGLAIHNRYLVDGLDITDPVNGTFSSNLAFDAMSSVQIVTGAMEAEHNALGGVINVITRDGSDELHAAGAVYVGHHKLVAGGNYGPNVYDGVQPFNDSPVGPTDGYQLGLDMGGPIVRRRLWFNVAYQFDHFDSSPVKGPPLGAPPYNIQHPATVGNTHVARLKLTWAPAAAHRISLSANGDPAFFDNTGLDAKNSILGVAETRQQQGGVFSIASWDWLAGPQVTTKLQAGFQLGTIKRAPQGLLGDISTNGCELFTREDNCVYDPLRRRHTNLTDGTSWYQGGVYRFDRRWIAQTDPSVSLRGEAFGSHDAKIGMQGRYSHSFEHLFSPGGGVYLDRGGPPLEAGLCDPSSPDGVGCYRRTDVAEAKTHERGLSVGFFAQDRWWTPARWLTVVPGLRIDYGRSNDRYGTVVSELWGFGPRLAVLSDLSGDGRTVLSVAYGRSNEVLSLQPASYYDGARNPPDVTRQWNPMTQGFTTLISGGGTANSPVIDHGASPPHADEITAGLRREIFRATRASVEYTWKRLTNYWDVVEINQIWDPTGARVVGWVDPMKPRQPVFQVTTPDENHRTYQGVDVVIEGQPTPHWDFSVAYTLSWLYGPGAGQFSGFAGQSQFWNPRQGRFFDGYLPEDQRHVLRGFGSWRVGRLNLGSFFVYQSGSPLTKTSFNPYEGGYVRYRSPQGTEPGTGNDIAQVSEFRVPDRFTVFLRGGFDVLALRGGQRLTLQADLANVFGRRTPVNLVTNDIDRFGQAAAYDRPFGANIALIFVY